MVCLCVLFRCLAHLLSFLRISSLRYHQIHVHQKFNGASYVGAAAKGEFQPKTSIKYTHSAEMLFRTTLRDTGTAERDWWWTWDRHRSWHRCYITGCFIWGLSWYCPPVSLLNSKDCLQVQDQCCAVNNLTSVDYVAFVFKPEHY